MIDLSNGSSLTQKIVDEETGAEYKVPAGIKHSKIKLLIKQYDERLEEEQNAKVKAELVLLLATKIAEIVLEMYRRQVFSKIYFWMRAVFYRLNQERIRRRKENFRRRNNSKPRGSVTYYLPRSTDGFDRFEARREERRARHKQLYLNSGNTVVVE